MSKVQFSILCPNGRKVNIKTEPQKPLLLLIEEACNKQGYIAENYDLKHLRKILDPTAMVRYANIPNNAQLELVEAAVPRQAAPVSVTLAAPSGRRFVHDFSSNVTLWEILMHHSEQLSSNEAPDITEDSEPVIVYTLQKINGEKLKSTTLKSLGLISGKCMLRYSRQKKRTDPSQPHVSSVMNPRKPVCEPDNGEPVQHTEVQSTGATQSGGRSINASQMVLSAIRMSNDVNKTPISDVAAVKQPQKDRSPATAEDADNKMDCQMEEDSPMESLDGNVTNEGVSEECTLISLCDGDAFLFSEYDIPATNITNENDSFYEISVAEVKEMCKSLVRDRTELEDAPLLTGRVRELEKSKRMLAALHSYPVAHLRICFPDRHIIQASFKPHNTIADVITFIRQFLNDSSLDFYLYTLYPRNVLEPGCSLVGAGCSPNARVYFGCHQKQTNYLKDEVVAKKSSFLAVSKAAAGNWKRKKRS